MQAYGSKDVLARLAAVYTKLLFIQDLGLVHAADVDDCMGTRLGLPAMSEGFDIWHGTTKLSSFTDDISAGIGTETLGNRVFEMKGAGQAVFMDKRYPSTLRLRLDLGGTLDELEEVPWPRGIYELGLMSDNNFELRLDGAKSGNFDAMTGFVLVAEASNDRIAGSIVLQRVMRLHAPLPVPEKFDPPLVVRFLIKN